MTWNIPVTAPRRNPTLPWLDFHFSAKWDRRSPKPQLRWSLPQICLRNVASSNLQLHIFSQLSLIVIIMPCPNPIGIRHGVLALVREGMWQSVINGHMGLTRATINRICGDMLPLELWCQTNPRGLLGRPHFVKTVHCWGWSDMITL